MVTPPSYPSTPERHYCPPESIDDLNAEIDALESRLDAADVLIAEVLRPEPVDWESFYTELFAELAAAGRQRAARMESGA